MATLGEAASLMSTYQSLLLSTTHAGLPLQPVPLQSDCLSYPSPAAPIGAQIPATPSPPTEASSYESKSSLLSINTQPSAIHLDAKFYSFDEFRVALEEWMSLNYHPFRVASSEMLRESEGTLNETFRYRYIVYHCAHYGNPRRRGSGKRPNQSYLPCGCTANLRLNYSFTDHCLKITTLKIEHSGHELTQESFAKCTIKVKKSPSEDGPVKKKGKKRAASACVDSPVSHSPLAKKMKTEITPPSAFRSIASSATPPQINSDTHSTIKEEDWMPAPPPNLPAPTPIYNHVFPLLMQQQFMMGAMAPLPFHFPLSSPLTLLPPIETQFSSSFNETPVATAVSPSEDKENALVPVKENSSSPSTEYATLQPMKSFDAINTTIGGICNQLTSGDSSISSELQSLMAKWVHGSAVI